MTIEFSEFNPVSPAFTPGTPVTWVGRKDDVGHVVAALGTRWDDRFGRSWQEVEVEWPDGSFDTLPWVVLARVRVI